MASRQSAPLLSPAEEIRCEYVFYDSGSDFSDLSDTDASTDNASEEEEALNLPGAGSREPWIPIHDPETYQFIDMGEAF